jgi:hypothetical protein
VKSEIVLVATVATGRASRPVAALLDTITTLAVWESVDPRLIIVHSSMMNGNYPEPSSLDQPAVVTKHVGAQENIGTIDHQ